MYSDVKITRPPKSLMDRADVWLCKPRLGSGRPPRSGRGGNAWVRSGELQVTVDFGPQEPHCFIRFLGQNRHMCRFSPWFDGIVHKNTF